MAVRGRRLRLLLVSGLAAAGFSAGLVPGPAFAHGGLAISVPVKDSSVTAPIEAVSLAFTEKPASFAYFAVTSPSGKRVDDGWSHTEPRRLDEPVREYQRVNGVWEPRLFHTGFPVRIPVAYWPEQGQYVARYQSVASDGEAVKGEVRFTYEGATTPPPSGWQAPTDQPSPELIAAAAGEPTTTGGAQGGQGPQAQAAGAAAGEDDGGSVRTWLVPVLLLLSGGFAIAAVARRPQRRPGD